MSNESQVTLSTVQPIVTGKYSCEVSADAPSFHTGIATSDLEVVGELNLCQKDHIFLHKIFEHYHSQRFSVRSFYWWRCLLKSTDTIYSRFTNRVNFVVGTLCHRQYYAFPSFLTVVMIYDLFDLVFPVRRAFAILVHAPRTEKNQFKFRRL